MLVDKDQIENIDEIYVLRECWNMPCGMGSGQTIINGRWMIPITYVAKECSMSEIEVLEHHLFASGLNVDNLGSMDFIKAKCAGLGIKMNAVNCSTLKYKNGNSVFADVSA